MRALDAAKEPWRALFIGGGPLEADIRRWAAGKADRVRLVTALHAEVPPYVNALDLLAAPSETRKNWAEQFGRMLVEAFACRVPVVGSDSGEIPHVLGDAGVVVSEGDAGAWTRAIEMPDGRTFVTDGAMAIDAKIARPAEMPKSVMPVASGKIMVTQMTAPFTDEVALSSLRPGTQANTFAGPRGIPLASDYVTFLRRVAPRGPQLVRAPAE